jgi:hypothetical protein
MSWKLLNRNTWKSIYSTGHLEAISGEDRGKQDTIVKGYLILMNCEILRV